MKHDDNDYDETEELEELERVQDELARGVEVLKLELALLRTQQIETGKLLDRVLKRAKKLLARDSADEALDEDSQSGQVSGRGDRILPQDRLP